MGKNLTIYLPNDVAKKMENFPEVNWSEICRKAVVCMHVQNFLKGRMMFDAERSGAPRKAKV